MYYYSIFAATSVGEGPPFDGLFLTREDSKLTSLTYGRCTCLTDSIITIVPLPPKNLTVNNSGDPDDPTTLLVTWERPSCDRGVLSGYELCYVESSVGDCVNNGVTVNITDPDQLSHNITGLLMSINYIVELRGRTGAGLGEPANATGTTGEDGT